MLTWLLVILSMVIVGYIVKDEWEDYKDEFFKVVITTGVVTFIILLLFGGLLMGFAEYEEVSSNELIPIYDDIYILHVNKANDSEFVYNILEDGKETLVYYVEDSYSTTIRYSKEPKVLKMKSRISNEFLHNNFIDWSGTKYEIHIPKRK